MDDVTAALHRMGVPSSVIAILALLFIAGRELPRFIRPARQSEREILSADEKDFRKSIMDELAALRCECSDLREELSACEKRHSDLATQMMTFMDAARTGTLNLLLSATPMPPATLADLDPGKL